MVGDWTGDRSSRLSSSDNIGWSDVLSVLAVDDKVACTLHSLGGPNHMKVRISQFKGRYGWEMADVGLQHENFTCQISDRHGWKSVMWNFKTLQGKTGWWFGTFLFSHILGIIIPIDFHIFQRGSNTNQKRVLESSNNPNGVEPASCGMLSRKQLPKGFNPAKIANGGHEIEP